MVDYSKWDHIGDSSDEEEIEEEIEEIDRSPRAAITHLAASRTMEGGPTSSRAISKYVTLAAGDSGLGLPEYIFKDPSDYVPTLEKGLMNTGWGKPEGNMEQMQRKITQQFNYGRLSKSTLVYPEEQFFRVIRERWVEKQKPRKALRDSLIKKDFVFRLTLPSLYCECDVKIFRVFRCSGGMTLRALADKVLLPLMGWVRNYHCWCFIRSADGAWAMPSDSGSIDVMHTDLMGFAPFDDREMKVADFFQEKGDSASFVYDLGDRWLHLLTVEEILQSEEGSVLVMEGGGACPPEDSNGCQKMGPSAYFKAINSRSLNIPELMSALNYRDRPRGFRFDPKKFDLEEARRRVMEAIKSPASSVSGSKVFNFPLSPDYDPKTNPFLNRGGKGEKTTVDQESFMTETVKDGTVKDPRNTSCCVTCGNPNRLKLCSGCGIVRYCSRECQVQDWKNHKPLCKKK